MPDRQSILEQHAPFPDSDSFPVSPMGFPQCPECGMQFKNSRGLGGHRRGRHAVIGTSRTAKIRRDWQIWSAQLERGRSKAARAARQATEGDDGHAAADRNHVAN